MGLTLTFRVSNLILGMISNFSCIYGSTTYVITDEDLELRLEIELSDLENPKFNLIEWYLKQIRVDGVVTTSSDYTITNSR